MRVYLQAIWAVRGDTLERGHLMLCSAKERLKHAGIDCSCVGSCGQASAPRALLALLVASPTARGIIRRAVDSVLHCIKRTLEA